MIEMFFFKNRRKSVLLCSKQETVSTVRCFSNQTTSISVSLRKYFKLYFIRYRSHSSATPIYLVLLLLFEDSKLADFQKY